MRNMPLLSVKEVSLRLCVPIRTVHRWVQDGHLPALRIAKTTRIPASAVDALLAPIMATGAAYNGTTLSTITTN